MDLATKLETEKLALLKCLDSSFDSLTINSLAGLADSLDTVLQDHLRRCLIRHAGHLFEADRIDEDNQSFYVDGIRLKLEILPNARKDSCLFVRLVPRDVSLEPSHAKLRKAAEVKIDGLGRYSSVVYDVSRVCPISNKDLLTTLTRDIFSVGHGWMIAATMKCIRDASDNALQSLYGYMRTIVTDRHILNGFVFSALLDEHDFVVLDEEATLTAIALAASTAPRLGRSPADLGVQAITQVIPAIESPIVDAVKADSLLTCDLTVDKYYQADTSFSDSMRAVWGRSISCFPILREGKMLLVAFFRTEFTPQLEPILIVHRAHLAHLAKASIGRVKKLLRAMMRASPSHWAETVGEFSGAFAAMFLRLMQHH